MIRLEWRAAAGSGAAALVVAAVAVSTGSQAGAAGQSGAVPRGTTTAPTPTPTATPTSTPTATPTSTPTPTPTPTDVGRRPLLPNLQSLKAGSVRITTSNGRRRLLFSSTLANVGKGPLEVVPRPGRKCPKGERGVDQAVYQDANRDRRYQRLDEHRRTFRPSGCMHFHKAHNHWHIDASARYWLTMPHQTASIVRHSKVSFCLRDSHRLPDRRRGAVYGACSRDRKQGITPGWADLYQWFLPGQSLSLPKQLKRGVYCLRQEADPRNTLRESDETDNASVRALRIRGTRVTYLDHPVRRCN
jgi:lysyl oxidase